MLIGSLVELHVGLHSCLCFSHLEKLLFKASLTPSRYLAVCQASSAFSYNNPDSFSTPGGSIEKAPASSIAPRHLLDRSRFFLDSDFLLLDSFLDTSTIEDQILDTYLDRYLDTSRYLHLSRFTSCLYKASVRSGNHFSSISLSILLCFSPKHTHLTPYLFLKDSSSFFKFLHTW